MVKADLVSTQEIAFVPLAATQATRSFLITCITSRRTIMNNKILMPALFACLFISSMAFAASGSVTINSPADGATVSSSDKIKLSYEAVPGTEGDHLHLNVDGKRIDVLRQLKGGAEIDPLAPG